jgi:3-deoxy-7-phosphoheptulonate synthase
LDGSNQLGIGIQKTRELMLELAQLNISIGTEFLDPLTAFYYDDLVSWGSIGARTCTSQVHRQSVSGLNMPIGFKNCLSGNSMPAIEGVLASMQPHVYMGLNEDGRPVAIQTSGNPYAHVVLRGGMYKPNYDPSSIDKVIEQLKHHDLTPSLLVDCSHHNSCKNYSAQTGVLQSVIEQICEGNDGIRGLMLESHLYEGKQALNGSPLAYGVSITDGCLDWKTTCQSILWAHRNLTNTFVTA